MDFKILMSQPLGDDVRDLGSASVEGCLFGAHQVFKMPLQVGHHPLATRCYRSHQVLRIENQPVRGLVKQDRRAKNLQQGGIEFLRVMARAIMLKVNLDGTPTFPQ
jgi:hypothetical protein